MLQYENVFEKVEGYAKDLLTRSPSRGLFDITQKHLSTYSAADNFICGHRTLRPDR
jgi:hypothetical protein